MNKLVVLELEGDLKQQGFRITLEIGDEKERHPIRVKGNLPANPELASHVEYHWQEKYRSLGSSSRIISKKIIHKGSIHQRIDECKASAKQLRSLFLSWLNADSFRSIDRRLREELNREDSVRLLISTESSHIHKLPWQEWDFIERYKHSEVAFSATEFEHPSSVATSIAKAKIKILAILGHSQGIDVEVDRHKLEGLPGAEVEFLIEPSRQEFNEQLWEQSWDLLFFAGHSETEGETGRIYLNPQDSLSLGELKYGLEKAIARGLKIAIFNSCDGLGLVQELKQLNIPQMIVMREPVPDQVAQIFLQNFLQAFAEGTPLYLAQREAREKLQGLEGDFPCASWLPVMYSHQETGNITWEELKPLPPPTVWWKNILLVFCISVLSTTGIIGLRRTGVFKPLEYRTYDALMRLQPHENPSQDPRFLVITLDRDDFEYQNQQGWTNRQGSLADEALTALLIELNKLNPAIIASDIYHSHSFSEELKQTLQQNNVPFYSICKARVQGENSSGIKPPPQQDLPPEYWGFSDVVIDADGVVRRHLLTMEPDITDPCSTPTSLNATIAAHYIKIIAGQLEPQNTSQELTINDTTFPKITQQNHGFYSKSNLGGTQILLNYRRGDSSTNIARSIPLKEILKNGINNSHFGTSPIVLIGVTARGENYDDFFITPYGEEIPGVFLQAQMISQIISAVLDERSILWFLSPRMEEVWIWGWTFGGGMLGLLKGNFRKFCFSVSAVLGGLFASCYLTFCLLGGSIPLVSAILGLISSTTLVLLIYRKSFKSYLSLATSGGLLGLCYLMMLVPKTVIPVVPSTLGLVIAHEITKLLPSLKSDLQSTIKDKS